LAARNDALLVAATDNNTQGDVYAGRLEAVAVEAGCGFERLRPVADDWNEDLRARKLQKTREGGGQKTRLPHARRPRQG
ncbi:MAG: toprim domain-containing protein, partial [Mesorhizobium sp.]